MATIKSTVQVLKDRKAMLNDAMSQIDAPATKPISAVPKAPVSQTNIKPVK
jgi:hypothetical protein